MGVNTVILIGKLGADPDFKTTSTGKEVCNLSLATNEDWVDKDGKKQEKTEWHRVVVWGKQAKSCSDHLRKGSNLYLEGKLETRKWEDKNGQERHTTEVKARVTKFLDSKESSYSKPSSGKKHKNNDYKVDASFTIDDLDF